MSTNSWLIINIDNHNKYFQNLYLINDDGGFTKLKKRNINDYFTKIKTKKKPKSILKKEPVAVNEVDLKSPKTNISSVSKITKPFTRISKN